MKFSELDHGDEFKHDGRLYEKDSVPDHLQGVLENAICLEDFTGAIIDPDEEVEKVDG